MFYLFIIDKGLGNLVSSLVFQKKSINESNKTLNENRSNLSLQINLDNCGINDCPNSIGGISIVLPKPSTV